MTTSTATMKPEEVYTKEEVDAMIAAAVAEAHEADRILMAKHNKTATIISICLLYTSPSPRDGLLSRMPSSA